MTWDDFYQRQHATERAIDFARQHPDEPLDIERIPAAQAAFASTEELLAALHYTWTQALTGRIGVALAVAEEDPHADRVQAVTRAWRQAAAEHPVLRRVLEDHAQHQSELLRRCFQREQRLLGLASGLADLGEPAEDIARIGSAFLRLLRVGPEETGTETTNTASTGTASTDTPPEARRAKKPMLPRLRKLIPSS